MSNATWGIPEQLRVLRPSQKVTWEDVPLAQEPLTDIIVTGNGKDAEVVITLRDGRQYKVGHRWLGVTGCPGLQVETLGWDDSSLAVRYYGPGLAISRLQCEVPDWGDTGPDEFLEETRRWVESGGEYELGWALALQIELTQSDPMAHADDEQSRKDGVA
jgi:hypothetical protein